MGAQAVEAVPQSTLYYSSEKISKVVQSNALAWSPTQARSTVEKARKKNSGAESGQMSPFCVTFVSEHDNSRPRTLNKSVKTTLQMIGRSLSHV